MEIKRWYVSKITWGGIVTTLLGITPIIATFLKLLVPNAIVIIDGAAVMAAGILIVIWRVWFTNEPIG